MAKSRQYLKDGAVKDLARQTIRSTKKLWKTGSLVDKLMIPMKLTMDLGNNIRAASKLKSMFSDGFSAFKKFAKSAVS